MTTRPIDLEADLNCEADEGRWWSVLDWAIDPSKIVPGAIVVAVGGVFELLFASIRSTTTVRSTSSGRPQTKEATLGDIGLPTSMYQPCTSTPVDSGE